MGYFCANFSLPRPLCSRLRPDVRDGQTDVRQTSDAHHRLMPPPYGGGGIISSVETRETTLQHCRQPERHPLNAVWLWTLFSFEQFSLSAYAHCTCSHGKHALARDLHQTITQCAHVIHDQAQLYALLY